MFVFITFYIGVDLLFALFTKNLPDPFILLPEMSADEFYSYLESYFPD